MKYFTMADSCLISLPSLISSKNTLPCQSAACKPFILHLSHCSHTPSILLPSLSLGRKTRSSSILTFVAQTSDWAQQEEETEGEGYTDEEGGGEGGIFDGYDDGEVSELIEEGLEDGDQVEPADDGDREPSEEAKLFVGNLPYDVDGHQLAELFKEAGTVEIAEVIYNRETDRSRGFGFVTMSTIEESEKAVEKFHRYDLGGRLLNVNKAGPAGTKQERAWREPSFRVYVGNLPWDVDNVRLEQIFSEHGKVVSAKIIYDRETGRSRGFGFVDIASESEMNDAISALDGQSLDGRVIRVSVAEQRPRRADSF